MTAFDRAARDVEAQVNAFDAIDDPAVRTAARALVTALLGLHRASLERILELAGDSAGDDRAGGADARDRLADDPVIGPLLILHNLHPRDVVSRVTRAVERVRERLGADADRVRLVWVKPDGHALVQLEDRVQPGGLALDQLHAAVQGALYETAPDADVDINANVDANGPVVAFVPIAALRTPAARGGGNGARSAVAS
jgi:hypothetical protein